MAAVDPLAPLPNTGTLSDVIEQGPDLRPPTPTAAPIEPPASLGDLFTASTNIAKRDNSNFDDKKLQAGYAPIVRLLGLPDSENPGYFNGLSDQGVARFGYMSSPSRLATAMQQGEQVPFSNGRLADRMLQETLIAQQIQLHRRKDPNFAKGYPDTVEGLHAYFDQQQASAQAADEQVLARSPGGLIAGAVQFGGSTFGAFHDPMNIGALAIPGGEGETLLQITARDALINGMLELSQQPIVAHNRAELGESYTPGEAATNVGTAAIGGGVFGGALHVGGAAVRAGVGVADGKLGISTAAVTAYNNFADRLYSAMPEPLQQKWGHAIVKQWAQRMANGDKLDDVFSNLSNRELSVLSQTVAGGSEKLTPDEQAAATVLERQQEVGETSPYQPGPTGEAAHKGSLAQAIKDIEDRIAPADEAPALPAAAPEPGAAATAAVTERPRAASSTVPRPQPAGSADPGNAEAAIASFKAKVGGAENATGNVNAKNPRSSASGPAQFTDGTFRQYYQKVYGQDPGAHPSIELKNNPQVQARLLDALTRDNAAKLQSIGETVNDGNLYLMHFLGSGDGPRVFKANADTPIEQILSADVLDRNPYLRGKSASEVVAWAHAKMGRQVSSVAVRPGFASTLDAASYDPEIAQLRSEAMQLDNQVIGATRLPDGNPVELHTAQVPVSQIVVDPERFQFKAGGDDQGVTDRLKGVGEWDPGLAGRVTLWEGRDSKLWLADGHQRVGLAKRIGDASGVDIPMDAMVLREADGVSAEDARTWAALKNISEGTGTAIDAAKVVRGAGEGALKRLPPKSALVRDAAALGRLGDDAFGAVYNGVIPPDYGAVIGHLLPDDPGAQSAMVELLTRLDPANRGQAESIVRQGIAAGFHGETQSTLFGERELVSSLMLERAKVLEKAVAELRKMKLVHKTAAENAGTLEATGSTIAKERSAQEAQANAQAAEIVNRLAFRGGPVAELINDAARELAGGAKLADVGRRLADRLRELDLAALSREAPVDVSGGAGADGSGRGGDALETGASISAQPGGEEEPGLLGDLDRHEKPTLGELEQATKRFSDPDGKAIRQQADSLEHDLKSQVEDLHADPAIADRQRQELALRANSPMRPGAIDAAGEIGLELFDKINQGDFKFRLDDEGPEMSPQDLLDELNADDAAVKAIKDCL